MNPPGLAHCDLRGLFAGDHGEPATSAGLPDQLAETVFLRRGERMSSLSTPTPPPQRGRPRPQPAGRPAKFDADLPPPGSILEKYQLERVIGMGGFAAVYQARHLLLEVPVAIKLLRPSVVHQRPNLTADLCAEARFAARIDHPNVVKVFDVTHTREITYIVMEYIDGPNLGEMIRRKGRLPARMVLRLIAHVAAGLRAGLAQGLIHRDVKPSNILLTRTGVTRLVDFGLALSSIDNGGENRRKEQRVVGTVGYMAPEQLLGSHDLDFRADIYSLGVTAYQAAIAEPPFPTDDAARCAEMHRTQPIPPLSRLAAMPAEVSDLIEWMLRKDRDQRPASYDDLLAALKVAAAALRQDPL